MHVTACIIIPTSTSYLPSKAALSRYVIYIVCVCVCVLLVVVAVIVVVGWPAPVQGASRGGGVRGVATPPNDSEQPHPLTYKAYYRLA